MRPTLAFTAWALITVSCSPPAPPPQRARPPAAGASAQQMSYRGGDGSSCDRAVVLDASTEAEGVIAEYDWIAARYPGYQRGGQALIRCSAGPADRIHIRTADGQERDVVFDISGFFGKF